MAALGAQAATVTWTGDANQQWNVAKNWDAGTAPGAGDFVRVGSEGNVQVNSVATVTHMSLDGRMDVKKRFSADSIGNDGRLSVRRRGSLQADTLRNGVDAQLNIGASSSVDRLTNHGEVVVGRRQTLTVGRFDQLAGSTLLSGTIGGDANFAGGSLLAAGEVSGHLRIGEDANLGFGTSAGSIGSLAVGGDAGLAGVTTFTLNDAADFDRLDVGGSAQLGGTINLEFGADFEPVSGLEFDLITATTVLGSFDDFQFTELDGFSFGFHNRGDRFTLSFSQTLPTVAAVPLPPSVWMFAAAACCAVAIGRRPDSDRSEDA